MVSRSTLPRIRPPRSWPASGMPVLAGRDALAATIAPVTGPEADAMAEATRRAERAASRLIARTGPQALDRPGLAAVRSAIQVYRDGGSITPAIGHAWLALVLHPAAHP